MKLSFLAAAALTAAATFTSAPVKADGNIGNIAITACSNRSARMPQRRAVLLALKSNLYHFQAARAKGYTPEEIGRQTTVQMRTFCPQHF